MNYSYLRLSTNEDNQSSSFEVQLNHIQAKHNIDSTYKDTCSGSTPFFKRTAWSELMSIIKQGDTIHVHRLDRLTRDTMHYLVMEAELTKLGVTLNFIDGVSGNDPMSHMIRTILSAVAQYEKSMIALRIKQAKQVAKDKGLHCSGSLPYGFSKDSDNYLIPNKKEQNIIRIMKEARESKHLSYNKIARYLTDLGYTTRNGGSFTSMGVSRALKYNN